MKKKKEKTQYHKNHSNEKKGQNKSGTKTIKYVTLVFTEKKNYKIHSNCLSILKKKLFNLLI